MHNAAKPGDIAKTVLMPGDPLRAKFIAEKFLVEPVPFNTVRNMFGYTGTYKGKPVSVMGHGMGMPSVGIYTYELFNFYGVDQIIRIGSSGAIQPDVMMRDIVIGMGACTDSAYAKSFELPGTYCPTASFELLTKAVDAAEAQGIPVRVGNIISGDVFYCDNAEKHDKGWVKMGVLASEMEAAALYMNAARAGKHALCMVTISDKPGERPTTAEEREKTFTGMMEVALALI
ncbi:purine-nucleoside phosphorylase [Cohnella sp. AR92]|uniref:purine-nucleoside phosphorylase n=1 Tax=Cohnella sp. AR92 TaxID=648716 RepID=UPI000F8EFB1E|nr:purine-nucleoside phosphorylase [Cohnella sp. AR92]RUS47202.1 purine-nucleoside phosphorylase [Cohnella sp. AR92]